MEIKDAVIRFVIAYIAAVVLIAIFVTNFFKPLLMAVAGFGLGISLIVTVIQLLLGLGPGGLCERIRHYCIVITMGLILIGIVLSMFARIFI